MCWAHLFISLTFCSSKPSLIALVSENAALHTHTHTHTVNDFERSNLSRKKTWADKVLETFYDVCKFWVKKYDCSLTLVSLAIICSRKMIEIWKVCWGFRLFTDSFTYFWKLFCTSVLTCEKLSSLNCYLNHWTNRTRLTDHRGTAAKALLHRQPRRSLWPVQPKATAAVSALAQKLGSSFFI